MITEMTSGPKVLIHCHNLSYYSSDGVENSEIWDVRQLNWSLHAGKRVHVQCHNQEQKQVIWRLFLNKLKPKSGLLEIHPGIKVYTDEMLWLRSDQYSGLWSNLQSRLFDPRPWLVDRRVHHSTLMDLLGLDSRNSRVPLDQLEMPESHKAWTVMLIAAKAQFWLVDSLVREAPPESLALIYRWLESFPGTWIVFGKHNRQMFDYDSYLLLDRKGSSIHTKKGTKMNTS